jgi:hypothetical protein
MWPANFRYESPLALLAEVDECLADVADEVRDHELGIPGGGEPGHGVGDGRHHAHRAVDVGGAHVLQRARQIAAVLALELDQVGLAADCG